MPNYGSMMGSADGTMLGPDTMLKLMGALNDPEARRHKFIGALLQGTHSGSTGESFGNAYAAMGDYEMQQMKLRAEYMPLMLNQLNTMNTQTREWTKTRTEQASKWGSALDSEVGSIPGDTATPDMIRKAVLARANLEGMPSQFAQNYLDQIESRMNTGTTPKELIVQRNLAGMSAADRFGKRYGAGEEETAAGGMTMPQPKGYVPGVTQGAAPTAMAHAPAPSTPTITFNKDTGYWITDPITGKGGPINEPAGKKIAADHPEAWINYITALGHPPVPAAPPPGAPGVPAGGGTALPPTGPPPRPVAAPPPQVGAPGPGGAAPPAPGGVAAPPAMPGAAPPPPQGAAPPPGPPPMAPPAPPGAPGPAVAAPPHPAPVAPPQHTPGVVVGPPRQDPALTPADLTKTAGALPVGRTVQFTDLPPTRPLVMANGAIDPRNALQQDAGIKAFQAETETNNKTVSAMQDNLVRMGMVQDITSKLRTGATAGMRQEIASHAYDILNMTPGVSPETARAISDSIMGGGPGALAAAERFEKLSTTGAMVQLNADMGPSGGRKGVQEFLAYLKAVPNINMNPESIAQLREGAVRDYMRQRTEQDARASFMAAGPDKVDFGQFGSYWAKKQQDLRMVPQNVNIGGGLGSGLPNVTIGYDRDANGKPTVYKLGPNGKPSEVDKNGRPVQYYPNEKFLTSGWK